MAENATPDTASDASLQGIVDSIVELMKSGVRPDVLEAQRLLLQRLANQGDVFPSRVPAPQNVTEVGGYLNLLELGGFADMRSSAIAGALGVAGPPAAGVGVPGAVPVGFVDLPNDRPAGPVQPSIPPTVAIRADFFAPLSTALGLVHAAGCLLPLRAPRASLPANLPSAAATLDLDVVLAALGRVLEVFPGTVLVDPTTDALAIARPATPATAPFGLWARELDGGILVAEGDFVAMRASATAVANDPSAKARYFDVAEPMRAAGWVQPEPPVLPASLSARGSLVRFVNLTALVAGETRLGEELALLYTPAAVARSALANFTNLAWNGTTFAPPT